jgi:hypothetical protein
LGNAGSAGVESRAVSEPGQGVQAVEGTDSVTDALTEIGSLLEMLARSA